MLTEAERVKLYELVYAFRDGRGGLTGIEQHVESLCAQARADALEEAAKVREELAQQRSYGVMDRGDQEAWCEASGMNECGKAIRARKDGQ